MAEQYIPDMGNLDIIPKQRKLDFIMLVDINNKIDGDFVNDRIKDVLASVKQIQMEELQELAVVISIITFAENAKCIVEQVKVIDYIHNPIVFDGVKKRLSNAYKLLNAKLTRKEFMNHTGKIAQPYILLITDGNPISDDNYDVELNALHENGWFTNSQRLAVMIGDAINSINVRNEISKFVSNSEEGIISSDKLVDIVNECRPKTIGGKNHIRTRHTVDEECGYEEAVNSADFGGFGGFDGYTGFDEFDRGTFI